jgi:colanic acid/amylovoran biosynthesis glycosyltransferase
MKVAYLLRVFPTVSETFILNEILEIKKLGCGVRIFSQLRPRDPCPHSRAKQMAGEVEYLPPLEGVTRARSVLWHVLFFVLHPRSYIDAALFALHHREHGNLWAFRVAVCYAMELSRFRPDVIHTHFASGNAVLTMFVAKLLGIPYTITIHGWHDLYCAPPDNLAEVIRESAKTVTVCEFNREHLLARYVVERDKVVVIRCGIPLEQFPLRKGAGNGDVIVSVGRLHAHKAHDVLIRACDILRGKGVRFRCVIVGDGELRGDLERLVVELGLTGVVEFAGALSSEQVSAVLRTASVFVLTSAVEVVGLAYAEAMATGLPVVGTRMYGVPELVEDGVSGYLCAAGDSECIAGRIESLLGRGDLGQAIGLRGRQRVEELHDVRKQAAALGQLWQEIACV